MSFTFPNIISVSLCRLACSSKSIYAELDTDVLRIYAIIVIVELQISTYKQINIEIGKYDHKRK